jgi:hypothetical protein
MKKSSLIVTLSLAISTASFAQTGTISLNKGQKFSVENKITAVSNQEIMGQSMESKADINTLSTIEVKEVKDNNFDLINNILRMKASMNAMGQDMGFDSDKKEDLESDKGPDLRNIINHPKSVTIDKSGKVISGKKTEAKSDPQDMTGMLTKLLGDNPNDDGYGVSMIFLTLPKNVAVGYSWVDSSSKEGIKKSTTYTVKEIKGSEAVISFTGTTETNTKSEMQGVEVTSNIKGSLKGEETVDTTTGVLKTKNTNIESSGTLSAQGMDIPMTTKITSSISVKGS